jgi:hypothetical protein
MSTPATPRSSGNTTRDQLDDLDALLQRMLDLPVQKLEDDRLEDEPALTHAELPEAEARVTMVESPPAPMPARHTRPVEDAWRSDSARPVANQSPKAGPRSSSTTAHAPAVAEPSKPLRAFGEEEDGTLKARVPPSSPNALTVVTRQTAAGPSAKRPEGVTPALPHQSKEGKPSPAPTWRPPLWLRWLIAPNRVFDQLTGRLGAPGRWLRGPWGRILLGVTSLLLIAFAVTFLVLDWIGWTW